MGLKYDSPLVVCLAAATRRRIRGSLECKVNITLSGSLVKTSVNEKGSLVLLREEQNLIGGNFGKSLASIPSFECEFNKKALLDQTTPKPSLTHTFEISENSFGKSSKNHSVVSESEEKNSDRCDNNKNIEKRREGEKGTKPSPQKIIDKRAKRKGFSAVLAKKMIQYGEENDSPMLKTYYNALSCCDTLIQEDGKLVTQHCKSRICVVCGAIRTAKAIDMYLPEIKKWDPYLVTLTIPNVKEDVLSETLDEMLDNYRNAQRSIKRRLPFKGIRKLEVTYNPKFNDYHGHFHSIVDGLAQAQMLREEWMIRNPNAKAIAQDVRRCDKKTLKEVFKYSMKILSSDEDESSDLQLYPHAVDVIVRALHRRRTYQSFGFRLPKKFDEDDFDGQAIQAPDGNVETVAVWNWIQDVHNWVNKETGELLSNYKPSKRRLKFLKKIDSS